MYTRLLLPVFALTIFATISTAQQIRQWSWSSWVPVLDRNENKVQVSITFVEEQGSALGYVDEKQKVPTFHYKLRNKYKEPVSGRMIFDYQSMNGDELTMSCVLYNLQPDQEYTNDYQSLRFVKGVSNFRFIEFQAENKNSGLISYTASDSVVFKLYGEIKMQEANKKNLSQTSEKAGITVSDNADNKIYYKGPNEKLISSLLSKVKGWSTNSGLNIKNGIPPKLEINAACQRDQYVYSALLYAWAAESYFRINQSQKANDASSKVGDLLNLATQLCGNGGLHAVDGACKTEAIFPCPGITNANNTTQTGAASISSSYTAEGRSAAVDNRPDFKNEKELFSGLLPVLASLNSKDYNQQATSISGFMNNLEAYSDKLDLDPITSIGLKLASLNVKLQAAEMGGGNKAFLNNFSNITGANSAGAGSSSSVLSGYGMQSSLQQEMQLKENLSQFADQFMKWTDPDHPTNNQLNRQSKLQDIIYNRNEDYRKKYGFTVKDFTDAIRNFDDGLLDQILSSGFPADTKVIHDNPNTEIQLGDYFGADYYISGLHYACIYGNLYAVKRFIEKGLDINQQLKAFSITIFGKENSLALMKVYPIDCAVFFNQYKIVSYLLSRGANTTHGGYLYGGWFKSAYEMAKGKKFRDIAQLL